MPIHDKSPRPQEFAAVDLGSNSFHMVIARVVDGAMQIIGRLKQRVHLADGLGPDNMLSEEAMTRGLNCLSLFAERLQGFSPASVCIVGTHTLRQALNATDFLKRAEKVIPYPIEIISGNEEARLIFMGVEHTQPEKGRKLVIDIGGGSTELVIGEISNRFSLKAAGWVVSALPSFIFMAGSSIKRIFSALAWRQHKNWKR
ncbi:exopolyphosphatase [Escherichia coli]|uniref:Exopolyphosphatase n=1 Tax=Escherichia coli TaxID=562 RepID=A0A376W8Q8_ECOLX|nr:exopolyphosphatase [Escherichia coli]